MWLSFVVDKCLRVCVAPAAKIRRKVAEVAADDDVGGNFCLVARLIATWSHLLESLLIRLAYCCVCK